MTEGVMRIIVATFFILWFIGACIEDVYYKKRRRKQQLEKQRKIEGGLRNEQEDYWEAVYISYVIDHFKRHPEDWEWIYERADECTKDYLLERYTVINPENGRRYFKEIKFKSKEQK